MIDRDQVHRGRGTKKTYGQPWQGSTANGNHSTQGNHNI